MSLIQRRKFLRSAIVGVGTALTFPYVLRSRGAALGNGAFRYRVVPGWGVLGTATPVNDCHGIVVDREQRIVLLTNHTANNVIIYDKAGRLVHKWGTNFPGAHGLSIVSEGRREVLFITDLNTHRVVKATLEGEILDEWHWPEGTGKYQKPEQYKPSWTLHRKNGEFFVLDGYGRDYIVHYGADGKRLGIFGGEEGGITHWGPHGGMLDVSGRKETLLIAMSDQQYLLRLDLKGAKLQQVNLPGGNPRQIRKQKKHYYVAHLADNWPQDRESRGFVSILDERLRVVANIGGSAPEHDDRGQLRRMRATTEIFKHPHDLAIDADGSIYVAQFASGKTYPIKLERV